MIKLVNWWITKNLKQVTYKWKSEEKRTLSVRRASVLIYASVATPNKRRNALTESTLGCAPHRTQVATLQAALIDKGVQEG